MLLEAASAGPNFRVGYPGIGGVDAPSEALAETVLGETIMVDYTIAAFPTTYNGRTYRSRLEARWAAFFDLMGWKHEYEPYDLGKWSPDFLLIGSCSELLVEVKPLTSFDSNVADRMAKAAHKRGHRGGTVLLLGVAPTRAQERVKIGWAGQIYDQSEVKVDWQSAFIAWSLSEDRPGANPDIMCASAASEREGLETSFCGMLRGTYLTSLEDHGKSYPGFCMDQWARATSTVQWQPNR